MAKKSGPAVGWRQAVFAGPIPVAANTGYVATYDAPTGEYAATPEALTQTVSKRPPAAPAASLVGGNGVHKYKPRSPSSHDHHNNPIINRLGPPVGSAGGSAENITIVATQ